MFCGNLFGKKYEKEWMSLCIYESILLCSKYYQNIINQIYFIKLYWSSHCGAVETKLTSIHEDECSILASLRGSGI